MVARNLSHCAQSPIRPGNGHAGFSVLGGFRSAGPGFPARRNSQPACGHFQRKTSQSVATGKSVIRARRSMMQRKKQTIIHRIITVLLAAFYGVCGIPGAGGYAFDQIVPDVRQPASVSGGSACPVAARDVIAPAAIAEQWSTVLGTNPVTILTQDQTPTGSLNEIEQVITQSMAVWTGVSGTTLVPGTFAPVTRTATQNACASDGVNSICFDQADGAFTPGILAFTRVITADIIGVQVGTGAPATQVGQILDAD